MEDDCGCMRLSAAAVRSWKCSSPLPVHVSTRAEAQSHLDVSEFQSVTPFSWSTTTRLEGAFSANGGSNIFWDDMRNSDDFFLFLVCLFVVSVCDPIRFPADMILKLSECWDSERTVYTNDFWHCCVKKGFWFKFKNPKWSKSVPSQSDSHLKADFPHICTADMQRIRLHANSWEQVRVYGTHSVSLCAVVAVVNLVVSYSEPDWCGKPLNSKSSDRKPLLKWQRWKLVKHRNRLVLTEQQVCCCRRRAGSAGTERMQRGQAGPSRARRLRRSFTDPACCLTHGWVRLRKSLNVNTCVHAASLK